MPGRDMVVMSQGELRRLHVVHKAIDKVLSQREAAETLSLSERQIRRIVHRVRSDGDNGIIHRLRGATSNRAYPDQFKDKVLRIFRDKYHDFGPVFASEKLFERDKIKINAETLRLWLIEKGVPYRKRKKRPHRQWRERKTHRGQMIQMDGSIHDWFEGRGPECVLMGFIDDATGEPFARFYEYEGTIPAMDMFKRYAKKRGIPLSVYLDKHTTYKSNGKPTIEEELNGTGPLSQFERALKELGVVVIHANSPQAKGRVERLFQTFQDRLIKEMRLAGISATDEANKFLERYLPVYRKRFGVEPAMPGDLHRPIPEGVDLDSVLCVKTERVLRNDFTVAHNKKLYQIFDNVRAGRVVAEDHINGSVKIRHNGTALSFKVIPLRSKKEPASKPRMVTRKINVPAYNHPWKIQGRLSYQQNQQNQQKEKVAPKEKGLLLTV